MNDTLYGALGALVIGGALIVLGYTVGVKLAEADYNRRLLQQQEQFEQDRQKYRDLIDGKGAEHATALDRLNKDLADTRLKLAGMATGRACLSLPAVRLLNNLGGVPAPAGPAASEPAGSPDAFATDRDVGDALALCRGEHSKLADQLNKILDIEEARLNPR